MKKEYDYTYEEFPIHTPAEEIMECIKNKGSDGYKLVTFMENKTHYTSSEKGLFRHEYHWLIFEKEIELDD